MTNKVDGTVYQIIVTRQSNGTEIDRFFTGYPERDISAEEQARCYSGLPVFYSVSVNTLEDAINRWGGNS